MSNELALNLPCLIVNTQAFYIKLGDKYKATTLATPVPVQKLTYP
ncbi:hypothetical protein PTUN_b0127 [Pseudoalteromonas tunicata]|uniref:Uncharacterized protein n=1 Tax=Pseudoalteromonas tunicata D2 TaxID=87626 RepID=A4C3K7_9GAMM|nr:hypothetical protein PTUN_b0127 [Pseudoalteromonas tunicata]EAR30139.1 hypothetical protein PTD2_01181 [Pseudoalteromonas tunicata D2]